MTKLNNLLALLALSPLASSQGGGVIPIPECLLQCRPWIAELTTFDCGSDCVADEVEIDFDLALGGGSTPYIPRFTLPSCTGYCPFGAEAFHYSVGQPTTIGAGLWLVPGGGFLTSPGAVVNVEFSIVPIVSVMVEQDLALLPWQPLSPAFFEPSFGFWISTWDTATFGDPAGYLLRVEMLDAALGVIDAYTIASDLSSCGFHSYGDGAGGANTLVLEASSGTCPGSTAKLKTSNVNATEAYTIICSDGDFVPLFGGSLFVDPATELFCSSAPVSGSSATLEVPIPPLAGLIGLSVFTQSLSVEAGTPAGFALSNGIRLDFCPCP